MQSSLTTAANTNAFPLAEMNRLRKRAVRAREITDTPPEQWSKSTTDPMALLAVFAPLWLREGYVLRAYQYRHGGDGHGVVWAMRADAVFPEPAQCRQEDELPVGTYLRMMAARQAEPFSRSAWLSAPKPPAALNDCMAAVEGDGSPWSYLCASLLARELREFGAMWHACDWSTHIILDRNPLGDRRIGELGSLRIPSGGPEHWTWLEAEPGDWRPQVTLDAQAASVTFFTFDGLRRQVLCRHTDRYVANQYCFTTESKPIAMGPKGYVFGCNRPLTVADDPLRPELWSTRAAR
jgi:hypothetical protein